MRLAVIALVLLIVPSLVSAQPEDRRRSPTADVAANDPCADAKQQRPVVPSTAPGFDPNAPVPQGATPFTGIAPPSRDPSRQLPLPPPNPDTAYEDCRRRLGR